MTVPATPSPGTSPPETPPAPPAVPPVVTPPPAPPPAVPPVVAPPAPPPTPATVTMPSDKLTERLGEAATAAERKLLKELGFDKPEQAKEALKLLKELQDASKSDSEKKDARIKELEPKAQRLETVTKLLASMVEQQFNALPEETRKAIDAVANGDADKRLELMNIIKATGLLTQAPPAAPVVTPPAAPAPPAPAPLPPAPASLTPSPAPAPSGTLTKFQEWESMVQRSPVLGDLFYNANRQEIERTRPAP